MTKSKILVIDDEAIVREIFLSAFEEYEIITVSNGNDALDILVEVPDIAIILIDVQMPGLRGVDLLREVKMKSPQSILIILTGHSIDDDEIKLLSEDADECIEKPFDIGLVKEMFLGLLN